MKAVILCAGYGMRLHPVTKTVPKSLIPTGTNSTLEWIINKLVGLVDSIGVAIPQHHEQVFKDVLQLYPIDKIVSIKGAPGTAPTLHAMKDFVGKDSVLVWFGDTLIFDDITDIIDRYYNMAENTLVAVGKTKTPSDCGILLESFGEYVTRIIEKPTKHVGSWAVAGLYIFPHYIFDNISTTHTNLNDTINALTATEDIVVHRLTEPWFDIGTPQRLIEATTYRLHQLNTILSTKPLNNVNIYDASLVLSSGVNISDTEINQPTFVGEDTSVINAQVGNTYIGPKCYIEDSIITNSIIMEGSVVSGAVIDHCIISPYCEIKADIVRAVIGRRTIIYEAS